MFYKVRILHCLLFVPTLRNPQQQFTATIHNVNSIKLFLDLVLDEYAMHKVDTIVSKMVG